MVKQLKRWTARLTTLTIKANKLGRGDIVYTGSVSNLPKEQQKPSHTNIALQMNTEKTHSSQKTKE